MTKNIPTKILFYSTGAIVAYMLLNAYSQYRLDRIEALFR